MQLVKAAEFLFVAAQQTYISVYKSWPARFFFRKEHIDYKFPGLHMRV